MDYECRRDPPFLSDFERDEMATFREPRPEDPSVVECTRDMEAGMTHDASVTRQEFERAIRRLQEEIRARPDFSPRDFVRREEFRLFKWFAGLAFAAILGGFGVLYQAIAEVQRGLVEVQRGLVEVQRGLVEVHLVLGDIRERLARIETVLDMRAPGGRNDEPAG